MFSILITAAAAADAVIVTTVWENAMLDRLKGKLTWVWIELYRGHARWAWRSVILGAFLLGKLL